MSNLDYELMLEECVEGTFFEKGPSGIVKKEEKPTENKDQKVSEKERFKKAMKYAAIAGVTGFALFKIVEKHAAKYVDDANIRAANNYEKLKKNPTSYNGFKNEHSYMREKLKRELDILKKEIDQHSREIAECDRIMDKIVDNNGKGDYDHAGRSRFDIAANTKRRNEWELNYKTKKYEKVVATFSEDLTKLYTKYNLL